ncbi:hypothetical protein BC829DRAFT_389656 [Chytridium lagenaria]|nr:hypothetical protein BC829DRAFT_389656 [Chytridium lagenaria]
MKENESRAGLTKEHSFRPSINPKIPDFDQLYNEFQRKTSSRRKYAKSTQARPFFGVEKHLCEFKERQERREEKKKLKEERRDPYKSRSSPRERDEPFIAKQTRSSELRKEQLIIAARRQEELERRERELDNDRRQIKKYVQSRLREYDTPVVEQKPRSLLKAQDKEGSYKRELKQIQNRLSNRLCLFEQSYVLNAKHRARAEYAKIMKDVHETI